MSPVTARLAAVLKTKPSVIPRAVFWKIPHHTARDDIRLQLGRYKKTQDIARVEQPESLVPKSELTRDHEECQALLEFVRQNNEPFRQGAKAFIPLDRPFDPENAKQIRALFSLPQNKDLVRLSLEHDVIPEVLAADLRHAERAQAVQAFEKMLIDNLPEAPWQRWFKTNSWVLGSQFVRILDERHSDPQHLSDFLMEAYDGFLDLVEIKRPEGGMNFWAAATDHGNYVVSTELNKAMAQTSRYIYEVEREANSVKFLERVRGVKTVKPRCVLVFGSSKGWNAQQTEAYRSLIAGFHSLTILT